MVVLVLKLPLTILHIILNEAISPNPRPTLTNLPLRLPLSSIRAVPPEETRSPLSDHQQPLPQPFAIVPRQSPGKPSQ